MTTSPDVSPLGNDFPAEDPGIQMIAALWTGYIRAMSFRRGPAVIIDTSDVKAMLELMAVSDSKIRRPLTWAARLRQEHLEAHVAEVAGRAPPPCPDIDGDVSGADRADGHREPCLCRGSCTRLGGYKIPAHRYCKAGEAHLRHPICDDPVQG